MVMVLGQVLRVLGGLTGTFGGTWASLIPERGLEDEQSRTLWG